MENYYEILGISTNANTEEIKAAWKEKIKKYHADKNQSQEVSEFATRIINAAHDTLSDPAKRKEYDLKHGIIPQTT